MTDLKDRTPRAQSTRNAESTHDIYADSWEQKGLLDTTNIPAREGMTQRWVKTLEQNGTPDRNNVFNKMNQGWRIRLRSDVEKGAMIPSVDFDGQDVIGIHGMILMERPIKQHESQRKHIRNQTALQMQGVKQSLFNAHQQGSGFGSPKMNNSSDVSRGRLAQADDD
jgi:hypothetical protein